MDIKRTILKSDASILDALNVINGNEALIAFVVDEKRKLIGTITDGDLRRAFLNGFSHEDKASDIMKKNFKYLHQGASYADSFLLMEKYDLGQVPIVNKEFELIDIYLKKNSGIKKYNPVIIMAGGMGKRLRPLTNNCPKPMLQVGGKPILERILESYIKAGFCKFYFSVNYLKEHIIEYFSDGSKWGVEIKYLEEKKALGTSGSLSLLPDNLDKPIIISNGDVLTNFHPLNMLEFFNKNNSFATLAVIEHKLDIQFGVAEFEGTDLIKFREKPSFIKHINAGIYILNPNILKLLPKNKFYDMPSLLLKAKELGKKVSVFPIKEYWLDIGNPDSLKEANLNWLIK